MDTPITMQNAKATIIKHWEDLAQAATSLGLKSLATDIKDRRLRKIAQEEFHVVVLGEFNHGKSTFINALLGTPILPAGITPTTATINHVRFGEVPAANVHLRNGGVEKIGIDTLSTWVTAAGKASEVSYVDVEYPAEILKNDVILVDTPGVNDLNEQRAEVTYGYVPRADAVLFLLDAGQALKESEREFLASHVLEGTRDRLIFVLGKVDLLSAQERDTVLSYVRENLAVLVPAPAVFPISAKWALAGESEASGLTILSQHLTRMLQNDRARVLLDNAAADAIRITNFVGQHVGLMSSACGLDIEDLRERVQSVQGHLDASKRKLDELHETVRADCAAIKAQMRLELDEFAKRFIAAMPAQLDAADPEDIKNHLGPFVEDRFRSFAEGLGKSTGTLLQDVAEKIITLTNQNVNEATLTMAKGLGHKDTSVDIDIDGFGYDVGVYAMGALGTTLFLFVNTLAGGLLTLAAPIAAILLKSKISGDLRVQAKERLPLTVLRAKEAMEPHLYKAVDEFADRLREFVTTAGNTLYRSVGEILQQAISEHEKGKGSVASRRAELETKRESLNALKEELLRFRSAIWSTEEPR